MGSSLPNHDAKGWKEQIEKKPKKENKENQGQIASNKVREKKQEKKRNLNDA